MTYKELGMLLEKNSLTTKEFKSLLLNDYAESLIGSNDDDYYDYDPLTDGYETVFAIAKYYGTPIPSNKPYILKFDVNGIVFEIAERLPYMAVPKKYIYHLAYLTDDEPVNQYNFRKRFSPIKALCNTNYKYF